MAEAPLDEAPTNLINAGTYVFEPRALDRIAASGRVSVERETFPALAAAGTLFAMADHAYWLDTGTPSAYLEANFDLVKGRRGSPVAPGLVRRGDLLLEGESQLEGEVVGPSVIFSGCRIEAGARHFQRMTERPRGVPDVRQQASAHLTNPGLGGRLSGVRMTPIIVPSSISTSARTEISSSMTMPSESLVSVTAVSSIGTKVRMC